MAEGNSSEKPQPGDSLSPAVSLAGRELPALSPNLAQILDLTTSQPFPMDDCIRAFEADAGLSARLLRLVNSSYFGLPRRLATVGHAARMLGERGFKGLAVSLAAAAATPRATTPPFDIERFWRDSLMRALVARESIGPSKDGLGDEAFAGAMLQNLGVPVFAVIAPQEYAAVLKEYANSSASLSSLEEKAFGFSHSVMGARVVEQWRLPQRMAVAVARHHEAPTDAPANDPVARIVRAVQLSAILPSTSDDDVQLWGKSLRELRLHQPHVDWLVLAQKVDDAFGELSMLFLSSVSESLRLAQRWSAVDESGS
jgi:HD-like signal output (HDOD) protein